MDKCKITIWTIINVFIAVISTAAITWYNIQSVQMKLKKDVTIGLMGDVMLGRGVNETINMTDYSYPWGDTIHLLKQNNINIINLETTLTNSNEIVPKVFNFKATPDKVNTLVNGNITVVNLANNHSLDFSNSGLKETINTLDKANIKHVGAGQNLKAAQEPAIIEQNGTRIGIIGFTDNEPDWASEPEKAGTNYIKVGDIGTIKKNINLVRDKVDILILSIHWGPNMRSKPTQEFRDFAHNIIDAGVDIIHGHSAHIFQPIEVYKNKIILYDTGDFVDDYVVDPILRNDESFLFLLTVEHAKLKSLKLVPVLIKNRQVNLASGDPAKRILNKIRNASKEFGTVISESGEITLKD